MGAAVSEGEIGGLGGRGEDEERSEKCGSDAHQVRAEPFGILLRRARCREVAARDVRSGGMVAVAGPATRATPSGTSSERDHEGTTVGQADVREVQDHPPSPDGAGDLLQPAAQAASGVARWHGSQASTSP